MRRNIYGPLFYPCLGLCPAGWVPGGLSCYKFVSKPLTWTEANGMCRELEGQLAVLDTAEKNAFITGYLHMKKGRFIYCIFKFFLFMCLSCFRSLLSIACQFSSQIGVELTLFGYSI